MVMARVQVQSDKAAGVFGKLLIESRGPFCGVEDHGNGSYSVQQFNKPQNVIRNFLAQDIYAVPPQILPCDLIDLPDLRYIHADYAPVKYSLKAAFDIESYNNMWLDIQ